MTRAPGNASRAEVADVHLLGGVRRAVVDDPRLAGVTAGGGEGGRRGGAGAEMWRGIIGAQPCEQRGGLQPKIDEAGAGNGDFVGVAEKLLAAMPPDLRDAIFRRRRAG